MPTRPLPSHGRNGLEAKERQRIKRALPSLPESIRVREWPMVFSHPREGDKDGSMFDLDGQPDNRPASWQLEDALVYPAELTAWMGDPVNTIPVARLGKN